MTRTLVAALTMAAFVSLQPLGVDADPVLSGPFVTVGVGDTFTIPISITGATEVTSWQFDLAYNPSMPDYIDAFEEAMERTSTKHAPWFIVPSDHKWFRDLAISKIIADTMEGMELKLPPTQVNLAAIRRQYHAAATQEKRGKRR